jgi:diguanylate cyclase (GGDEF)-like protein
MREGRSLVVGRWKILVPSFVTALLPFVLFWLPDGHWRPVPFIVAGVVTVVIAGVALWAPSERLPGWAPCALSFAYLLVFVLLRAAGGPSGVAPMVLLPVFWLGLYGSWRQLWSLLAAISAVLIVPMIVVGGPEYPASAWRAAIMFIAASAIIGATLQSLVAYLAVQERERTRLLAQLDDLAHTDELTGLPNRRAWEAELDRGLARARRTREPVSIAVIDIDRFKSINDAYGHPGGDGLLVAVARSWRAVLRPDDVPARIGGDEFAVLLAGCTEAEAAVVIRRLREQMPAPYSCSVGLATWDFDELADRLMLRADNALYDAKRGGRDRATAASVAG